MRAAAVLKFAWRGPKSRQDAAAMTDSSPRLLLLRPSPTVRLALSGLTAPRSLSALVALSALAGLLHAAEPATKAQNPASPAAANAAASPAITATNAAAANAEAAASAARGPAGMRTPYRPRKPGPIGAAGAAGTAGTAGAGGAAGAPAGPGASFGAAAPISPGAPGSPAAASGEPLLGTPIKLGPGDPLERLRERLARGVALDGAARPGSRGTPEIKVDNRASGEFVIKAPPPGATATARTSRAGPAASRGAVVAGTTAAATAAGAEARHGADAGAGAHGPAWGYARRSGPAGLGLFASLVLPVRQRAAPEPRGHP